MSRSLCTAVLLAGLFFSSLAATAIHAQVRGDDENWQVTTAEGTPFSAIHTSRRTLPDGAQHLRQESRTLVDLLGQRQEILESAECQSRADFFPVSYRHKLVSLSGDTTSEGRIEGKEYVLTLRRGETTLERRTELPDQSVFGEQLPDFLASKRDASGALNLTVLNGSTCIIKRGKATRTAADGGLKWHVDYEDGVGNETWTFKADGSVVRGETTWPSRLIELATAESAGQIRYYRLPNRELLSFPVKESIAFPDRAKSITLRLTWRTTPLEYLVLEDARQKLSKHDSTAGEHVAIVRLEQPAPISQPAKLPIQDPAMAPYLAQDAYIRPEHPAIRQKAAEWTAGATDSLDAAGKLCHNVSAYLSTGEMIVETLSGPEVLECRKGKCADFSTFLASLGRAAGIPTRIALGMRLVGGNWVGHMWCEMWVGQWIPVDATADEVGGSPALLKVTHSDNVMGTQRARWALTDSLAVEVVGVERAASLSTLKTGIEGRTYANADYQFRITTPDDGWKITDRSAGGNVLLEIKPPENAPAINLVTTGLTVKLDVQSLLASRKSIYTQRPGYELVRDEVKTIAGQPGRLYEFRLNAGGQARKVQSTEVLWMHDKTFYLMNFATSEAGHAQSLAQLESLLAGFEQVQPPTP